MIYVGLFMLLVLSGCTVLLLLHYTVKGSLWSPICIMHEETSAKHSYPHF